MGCTSSTTAMTEDTATNYPVKPLKASNATPRKPLPALTVDSVGVDVTVSPAKTTVTSQSDLASKLTEFQESGDDESDWDVEEGESHSSNVVIKDFDKVDEDAVAVLAEKYTLAATRQSEVRGVKCYAESILAAAGDEQTVAMRQKAILQMVEVKEKQITDAHERFLQDPTDPLGLNHEVYGRLAGELDQIRRLALCSSRAHSVSVSMSPSMEDHMQQRMTQAVSRLSALEISKIKKRASFALEVIAGKPIA